MMNFRRSVLFYTLLRSSQFGLLMPSQPPRSRISQTSSPMRPEELLRRVYPSLFIIEVANLHGDTSADAEWGVATSRHTIVSTKNILETVPDVTGFRGETLRHRPISAFCQGNRTWNVEKVPVDPFHDVSSFESADLEAIPAQPRKSNSLRLGERVHAIHYGKPQDLTVSDGVISGLTGKEEDGLLTTSITLSAESSGGGLFDSQGKLIGLISYDVLKSLNPGVPIELTQGPLVVFSSEAATHENWAKLSNLWDQAEMVTDNLQQFEIAALTQQQKTQEEAYRLVHRADDDGGPIQRLKRCVAS